MSNKKVKRRILFKVWKFPILSETFILSQVITAIKCGFEVRILVEDLMDLSTHQDLIKQYQIEDKIIFEDYKIPQNKFLRYTKAIFLVIRYFLHISKLFSFVTSHRKFEIRSIFKFHFFCQFRYFDIVHVQYGTNGRPLDLLKKIDFFPPKLVVSFHGHDLFFPINGIIQNDGYYEILFDQADLLIANTPYLEDLLLELGAPREKIKVIPVGVDTDFFKKEVLKSSPSEYFNLITVGRLEVLKGQNFGIKCIRRLIEKGYTIHYTLVGSGSQDNTFKNLVKEEGLCNHVTFTGRKSQYQIKELLQGKDLFLMTSVRDSNRGSETQGLVTAEAQACGLPVIAFDSGGVKYTVLDGKSGYVVPEGDVIAMANKIETLILDADLRMEMGKKAVDFIEKNFSQHYLNKIWKRTYVSLLEKHY